MKTNWQSMDTAPEDTAILVYSHGFYVAHYNSFYSKWIGYGENTIDTLTLNRNRPTHWMPLPEAPKANDQEHLVEGHYYFIKQLPASAWEPAQRNKGGWWITGCMHSLTSEQVYAVGKEIEPDYILTNKE